MRLRKITLRNDLLSCRHKNCSVPMHGPFVYGYIRSHLGSLASIYIGKFVSMPCLVFKGEKWVKFFNKKWEEK